MDEIPSSWAPFAQEEYVDMEAYKYSPISSQDEIRCLVLEPGQDDDPLFGSIKTYKLTVNPEYEAISYTWGLSIFRSKIFCDGRQISITRTLRDSLCQCRLPNKQRVLWADSICINQDDNHEKAHQVRLMADIYSQALQVLICFGPSNHHHAERAFSFIRDVNHMVEDTLKTCQGWNSFPKPPLTHPLLQDTRWESFAAFTKEPWFYRGWVVQEAVLAVKAQVFYGRVNCDWIHILRTFIWAATRSRDVYEKHRPNITSLHRNSYKSRAESECVKFYNEHAFTQYSLLMTLDYARNLSFTDPRDRIYAFMGLPIAKDYRDGLEISYERTALETYRSFARFCVDRVQDLELLQFVQHDENTLSSTFPSWIPQWQTRIYRVRITRPWHAPISPERMPRPTPVLERGKDRVEYLKLKGIVMDTVAFASDCLKDHFRMAELAEVWASLQEYEHRHGLSVYTRFPPIHAFLAVITNSMNGRSRKEEVESMYIRRLERQLPAQHVSRNPAATANSASLIEDELPRFAHNMAAISIHNRKVAITRRGFYCLLPGMAKEGDLCCILYGTMAPFVLRNSVFTGLYQLLGEAFIVSSYDHSLQGYEYPLRVGAGFQSHPEWLDFGLEDQDIVIV